MPESDYHAWLRWWRERGAAELEELLRARWDLTAVTDEAVHRRWAVRIGMRLRHGISAEELFDLLASETRRLQPRVNERALAALAMEIRHWYRRERDDPARAFWPVSRTRPEEDLP